MSDDKIYKIAIENQVYTVTDINYSGPDYPVYIDLDDGTEWVIFQDMEAAGEAAREYWEDMANNDPKEFTCIVGEETLVQWGLGRYAGPGSTQVPSLQEWLDLWLDVPEEHWAGYDGVECGCTINRNLQDELGLDKDCVCYRHN